MSSKKSIFLILILLLASTAAHAGVILDCDFEDQPLDQLLGTGGAEAGQPVSLGGVNAYVRTDPGGDRAVEITDHVDFGTREIRFEFLNNAEYSEGTVVIQLTLHFALAEDYVLYVREQGSSASSYATFGFQNDGDIYFNDADGSLGNIGSYTVGVDQVLRLAFDQDARTVAIEFDGVELVAAQSHGVATGGIGALLVGFDHDTDLDAHLYVDDIIATYDGVPVETRSVSEIKADW